MYLATQDSTYSIAVSHSQTPFCLHFCIEQEPKSGGRKQFGHARLTITLYLLAQALYNKHIQISRTPIHNWVQYIRIYCLKRHMKEVRGRTAN